MTEKPESDGDWIDPNSTVLHPTTVILSVTRLEDWLEAVLKARMRDLTSRLNDRIFHGYGPLSSLSAKIDIAYALKLFDDPLRGDMHALREIRNAFAHATDPVHFRSPALVPFFEKLTGWTKDSDPRALFIERVNVCVDALKPHLDNKAILDAVRKYYVERASSPEKSE